MPPITKANKVGTECQAIARELSDRQNAPETRMTHGQISRIVTAMSSAGNILTTMDRFDPAGPAPAGFEKKITYDDQGRVVVSFTQTEAPQPTVPTMPEGYGHPDPTV